MFCCVCVEMERQQHFTELRAKRRNRGKGKGAGSEQNDWKLRRDRSQMVGISGPWRAYLDPKVGVQGGGGTIFYHNDAVEERTGKHAANNGWLLWNVVSLVVFLVVAVVFVSGVGSTWDRPIEWEGVVGGPDMMLKVDDWLVEHGLKKPAVGEKADTPRTKENKLSEARVAKIEAEKQRRVDDKEREKKEHYWQGKLAVSFEVFFFWCGRCCGGVVVVW